MADLQKTIEIIFSGVDELSGPMSSMAGNIAGFGDKVEDFAQPFSDIADGIIKADVAIAAMAAGGLAFAVSKAMDFESAIVEVNKVLGEGESIDKAIAKAKDLAIEYGTSSNSILSSMADFKQAGFDLEEAMQLAQDAMDMSIAGDMGLGEATEAIKRALNGFGEAATEAERLGDIITEISNNYSTNASELANGMAMLSPIASQMNLSMEETAGLLTPIIEVFGSGAEAANSLRTGLLRLTDDSKPVRDALTDLGVSQTTINGEMRSGKDIFIDVANAMQGLSKEEQLYYTQQLTGIEQAGKMVIAFREFDSVIEIAESAMNSFGAEQAEVNIALDKTETKINALKEAFNVLGADVGFKVKDAFGDMAEGGTELAQAFSSLVDAGTFDPVLDAINSFATKAGDALSGVAQNLPEAFEGVDFDGLLDAIGGLGDAIGGWFDSIDFTTPEGLHDLIQDIIDAGETLAEFSTGIAKAFDPYIQAVLDFIRSTGDMESAAAEDFGKLLGHAKAITTFGAEFAGAILIIGEAAGKLGPAFTGVGNAVGSLLDIIEGTFHLVVSGIAGFFEDLLQAAELVTFGDLGEEITAMRKSMGDLKDSALDNFATMGKSVQDYAGEFDMIPSHKETELKAEGDTEAVGQYVDDLELIPAHKETDLEANPDESGLNEWEGDLNEKVPDSKTTDVKAEADQPSISETGKVMDEAIPPEKSTVFQAETDGSLADVKAESDEAGPPEKTTTFKAETDGSLADVKREAEEISDSMLMKIQLQGNIETELARIEASAATTQSALEWTAKVEIANAQYAAEQVVSAFNAAHEAVASTADAASSMFDSLLGNWEKLNNFDKSDLMGMVREQMQMEKDALENQKKLTDAQIELMKKKADALASGEGLIKIESDGLEPALELVMWEILQKVQLRVTEESSEFLLGLGAGI